MIISITNTSTEDYSANSFGLPSKATIWINTARGDDIRTNENGRLVRMTVASGYVNPFGGNSADVPEFDPEGNAAEKLFVSVWSNLSDLHVGRNPLFTNHG